MLLPMLLTVTISAVSMWVSSHLTSVNWNRHFRVVLRVVNELKGMADGLRHLLKTRAANFRLYDWESSSWEKLSCVA